MIQRYWFNMSLASLHILPELTQILADPDNYPMPWHVVVGYDEHVPGDKLKIKNLRKSMVLAFNFLELGEEVLQRDSTWFIPVIVRSSMLENVHAGWSQALKLFLRRMLIHESSPAKAGIPFICDDIAHIIYAIVSDIMQTGTVTGRDSNGSELVGSSHASSMATCGRRILAWRTGRMLTSHLMRASGSF